MLPLVIRNNGIKPVKFMLHLEDEHGVFLLKGRASTFKTFQTGNVEGDSVRNESKPAKQPFFLLRHGQSAEFDVIFKPTLAQRLEGKICLLVGDSCLTLTELVGEGHMDEFTLDGLKEDPQERNAKSSLKKDIIDAVRANHIQFGHCPVGKRCRRTFTITNHTRTQFMRFVWDADAIFQFSPKVGHLHPGCAKGITVTLKADVPGTFRRRLVKCKVTKINFKRPRRKVPDWDDQMCIVTWKDIPRKDLAARWFKKERVVETVPEPAHTVLEKSSQEAEVYLSAIVFYTQFKLSTTVVQFKDTSPLQTRIATFRLSNTGKVALEYSWEEAEDSEAVKKQYSSALMHKGISLEVFPDAICDWSVFSIKPYCGTIYPGQKQAFYMWFSPKCEGTFETTLQCRIPNPKPNQKTGQVIVKAQEQKSLGKPLEQREKGQRAKKQKPAPKGQNLCQLKSPEGTSNIVPSAAAGLPPFTRDLCSPHLPAHAKSGCTLSAPRAGLGGSRAGLPNS
ncbi:hydrocephalus-inducing protein homolog [Haemorhous mexicanus]|uniref:hydrocephalus-inducing protein homolog n=1 Tax=Haemorhous mexicanus TaxID=30427 RepID=UPI0028BEEBF1|nr:hydrocephalus-inducing protein homolog [Haemorhous mexicanus]